MVVRSTNGLRLALSLLLQKLLVSKFSLSEVPITIETSDVCAHTTKPVHRSSDIHQKFWCFFLWSLEKISILFNIRKPMASEVSMSKRQKFRHHLEQLEMPWGINTTLTSNGHTSFIVSNLRTKLLPNIQSPPLRFFSLIYNQNLARVWAKSEDLVSETKEQSSLDFFVRQANSFVFVTPRAWPLAS